METLGDDLVLLSILRNGVIGTAAKLRFGLSGSELVRLTALRRINITSGRIIIVDKAPTGDALLDKALASMKGSPPEVKEWVANKNGDPTPRYLERLVSVGMIVAESRKALGLIPVTGWRVLDAGRLAAARARLDAIAYGSGGLDPGQAALAGLASAIGLPSLVYPGFRGRGARRRIAAAVSSGGPATHVAAPADVSGISGVELDVATRAAVTAATDADVQASIEAATQAVRWNAQAVDSGGTQAAHHGASHGGHAGGGHH